MGAGSAPIRTPFSSRSRSYAVGLRRPLLILSAGTKRSRLDVRSPMSVSYIRGLAAAQRSLQRRITTTIPDTSVRWHYQVVLDGISVVAPRAEAARISRLPGVAHVYPA